MNNEINLINVETGVFLYRMSEVMDEMDTPPVEFRVLPKKSTIWFAMDGFYSGLDVMISNIITSVMEDRFSVSLKRMIDISKEPNSIGVMWTHGDQKRFFVGSHELDFINHLRLVS